ncbi:YoaK family protein [Variovorax sp. UC74_104]|uniref:YoaK family protein n=1 Tax=Variovorax sp. UC74_104 TaxID=3374555 RepID=UPI003756FA27
MKPTLPQLMSLNGGFVDTAGFLALHGLFTAHVTGNFVTIGAALVHGTSGALTKLLALPVFCAVVMLARLLSYGLPGLGLPVLRTMLVLKAVLLLAGGVLAIRFGPFADGDSAMAMLAGLVLVSAMAIQNAVHRIHLGSAPPTTLMTGTTTQVMVDLADLMRGGQAPEEKAAAHARIRRMSAAVAWFATGCAAAALIYARWDVWCFAVPPVLAALAVVLQGGTHEGDGVAPPPQAALPRHL